MITDWGYKARAEVSNLVNETRVTTTKFFYKYGDFDKLIKSVFQHRLLQSDATLIHAAGLKDADGNGILIQGWSNMGKTSTALLLAGRPETTFYGDDTVIISEDRMYSYPRNIGLSPGTLVPEDTLTRVEEAERTLRSIVGRMPLGEAIPLYPDDTMRISADRLGQIGGDAAVDRCFYLHPPDNEQVIKELPEELSVRRSVVNSRLNGPKREGDHHLVRSYFYLDDRIDENIITAKHEQIVREFFKGLPATELASEKEQYLDLIAEFTAWDRP